MPHFIDILQPHYEALIKKCEKQKIAVNLDIQDLTVNIRDAEPVEAFLKSELQRAIQNCTAGDKITLSESSSAHEIKIAIKNSGRNTLTEDEKAALRDLGYHVHARFGYDTTVGLIIER